MHRHHSGHSLGYRTQQTPWNLVPRCLCFVEMTSKPFSISFVAKLLESILVL
jgi:hypothetical protein